MAANPYRQQSRPAVVRIVAVDDGQVHFQILPGAMAKNRHLLTHSAARLQAWPAPVAGLATVGKPSIALGEPSPLCSLAEAPTRAGRGKYRYLEPLVRGHDACAATARRTQPAEPSAWGTCCIRLSVDLRSPLVPSLGALRIWVDQRAYRKRLRQRPPFGSGSVLHAVKPAKWTGVDHR